MVGAPMNFSDDGNSKRQHPRRPVKLPAQVTVAGRTLPAVVENISPGGAFLRVRVPEDADTIIASLSLPQGKNLHVLAQIRWRRPSPAGVGVRFDSFLDRTAGEPALRGFLRGARRRAVS